MEEEKKKEVKNFKYYWDFIDIPVFILIGWAVISILPIRNYIPTLIFGIIDWILKIAVFAYLGYTVAKVKSNTPKNCAKAGAFTGIIIGLAGAILTIIIFHAYPSFFNSSIQQITAAGVDYQTAMLLLKIGVYSGIVTGPLFSALIGALISWIAGLITKKYVKSR